MAWFLNRYTCYRCAHDWTDQWSSVCDDDCPQCGARHTEPHTSDELTTVINQERGEFVVRWSPETAEHAPDYCELGRFKTRQQAIEFLASDNY
jgi:predicted  nucleic acid-binding Zn-ribbon protein